MKKINITKMIMDNDLYSQERMCILGMEFIKLSNGNYMIKNSNNRIVNEKEKLQLENDELVLEDINSRCAKDITKKISKNKKRIKEIEEVETDENIEETESVKE